MAVNMRSEQKAETNFSYRSVSMFAQGKPFECGGLWAEITTVDVASAHVKSEGSHIL